MRAGSTAFPRSRVLPNCGYDIWLVEHLTRQRPIVAALPVKSAYLERSESKFMLMVAIPHFPADILSGMMIGRMAGIQRELFSTRPTMRRLQSVLPRAIVSLMAAQGIIRHFLAVSGVDNPVGEGYFSANWPKPVRDASVKVVRKSGRGGKTLLDKQ